MKIDKEFSCATRPLTPEELAGLEMSLKNEGCHSPLIVWKEEDTLLDGHNRLEVCTRLGIHYAVKEQSLPSRLHAVAWILGNQAHRRNLSLDEMTCLAVGLVRIENEIAMSERGKAGGEEGGRGRAKEDSQERDCSAAHGAAKQSQKREKKDRSSDSSTDKRPEEDEDSQESDRSAAHGAAKRSKARKKKDTRKKVAKKFKISQKRLKLALALQKADPFLYERVEAGELTLTEAIREWKRKKLLEKLTSVEAVEAKKIEGVYDVVVVDPPWPMEKIDRDVRPNQSEMDYPTMDEEEMSKLEVPCADDCHLWLWTTHKFLPMAFRLLDKWGLKYVCAFVWHKPGGFQPIGLPQYNCEFALYARKGTPAFIDTKAFSTCFDAPRGAHSEKPEEFYAVLRRVTAGRRIDMFNRRPIEGFDSWGKEAS